LKKVGDILKRVLITGSNSYVGTNVEKWLMREPNNYYVETLDMKNLNWEKFDFSSFDVVFHVAGIAHISSKKSMEELYYKVNRDLTIETAKKAKKDGVSHFVFMSSMIVYNSKETVITKNTIPNPDNFYGQSKLQAEEGILQLKSDQFKISIIRAPMIYGDGSKGNFSKLIKSLKYTLIFPKFYNKRSVIYIDNLSNTVQGIINNDNLSMLFPQNDEYFCTYEFVRLVAILVKRKILFLRVFNPIIYLLRKKVSIINKMFGDSYYYRDLSELTDKFNVVDFEDSLEKTLKK
jgi:UDP-glucose 4-epimerase